MQGISRLWLRGYITSSKMFFCPNDRINTHATNWEAVVTGSAGSTPEKFNAEKGVAQKLNPAALGIRKGEWKFLELPVSTFHFRPKRSTVEEVRALQFSPDAGFQEPAIFRLDDILLAP